MRDADHQNAHELVPLLSAKISVVSLALLVIGEDLQFLAQVDFTDVDALGTTSTVGEVEDAAPPDTPAGRQRPVRHQPESR